MQFDLIPQYTRVVRDIRFKQNPKSPYLIVYFSENSNFFRDYEKLGFRKQDVRHVVIPRTRVPVSRLDPKSKALYQSLGLLAYDVNMAYPKNKNIFFDLSLYLDKIEDTYKPITYRQRAGFLVQSILFKTFNAFPSNYQKILIYSVDPTRDIRSFVNRKIFPLVRQLKAKQVYFDDMLLTTIGQESASHRLIIKEKDYQFPRVLQFLKRVKIVDSEAEENAEVSHAAKQVLNKISSDLPTGTNAKIGDAIRSFLGKDKESLEKVNSGEASSDDVKRIAVASVLTGTSGNTEKAKNQA